MRDVKWGCPSLISSDPGLVYVNKASRRQARANVQQILTVARLGERFGGWIQRD